MSGDKDSYIDLTDTERDRLMTACEQLDDVQTHLAPRLQQATQHFREALDRYFQRHQQTTPTPQSAQTDLTRLQQQHDQATQTETTHFHQTLQTFTPNDLNHACDWLQTQINHLQARLSTHHTTLITQTQQLPPNTNKTQWATLTQRQIFELKPHIPPAEWDNLIQTLQTARNETQTLQTLWLHTQTLRHRILQQQLHHEAALHLAQYSTTHLIALCDTQQQITLQIQTPTGNKKTTIDLDYWTEGKLSTLRQQLQYTQQQFTLAKQMKLSELQRIITDTHTRRQQLTDLITQAKNNLIASQLRRNLGQTIEQALQNNGWKLIDSTYEGQDHRRALHLKWQNTTGDEMITIITPDLAPHQGIRNHLRISYFPRNPPADHTQHHQNLQNILTHLRQKGLACSTPQCAPGTETQTSQRTERRNFEHIRRQKH